MSSFLRTFLKSGSTVLSSGTTVRTLSNISSVGTNLLKNMDLAKYSKIAGKTTDVSKGLSRPTSSLVNAGDYLGSFANIIPSSTDEIFSTVIKSSDEILDSSSSVAIANANTFRNIKNATNAIKTSASSVTNLLADSAKKISRVGDDIFENSSKISTKITKSVDNVDDVGSALKKSKGVSKVDDVLEATDDIGGVSKKLDNAGDAADATKTTKKAQTFIQNWGGAIQIGILTSYLLGSYINTKLTEKDDEEDDPFLWITDPESEIYEIESKNNREIIVGNIKSTNELISEALLDPKSIFAIMLISSIIIYYTNRKFSKFSVK